MVTVANWKFWQSKLFSRKSFTTWIISNRLNHIFQPVFYIAFWKKFLREKLHTYMHVSFSSSMSLWNLFEYTRPVCPALLCANWAPLIAVVSIPFSPWIVVQRAGRNRTKPRSIKHIFFLTIIRSNRFTIYSSIILKILRLLLRIKRARRNRKKENWYDFMVRIIK